MSTYAENIGVLSTNLTTVGALSVMFSAALIGLSIGWLKRHILS